jgi:nuclear transport factor 2 (NTF2) superfamily protein
VGNGFLEAWNAHDPERLLAVATEDVVWEDPFIQGGSLRGRAALRDWLSLIWRAMPDLRFELVGEPFISQDGTQLAAAWKGVGRSRPKVGDFKSLDFAATWMSTRV